MNTLPSLSTPKLPPPMHETYLHTLRLAELQYKLALQVSGPGSLPDQNCVAFAFGKFSLGREDLLLSDDEAKLGAAGLERVAINTLAIAADTALEQTIPNRFESTEPDVVAAARIARILRNAFAHDPFFPRWNISNRNHIGVFEIPGVLRLDTRTLDGQPLDWRHYGGPLALLLFVAHCRTVIEQHCAP